MRGGRGEQVVSDGGNGLISILPSIGTLERKTVPFSYLGLYVSNTRNGSRCCLFNGLVVSLDAPQWHPCAYSQEGR